VVVHVQTPQELANNIEALYGRYHAHVDLKVSSLDPMHVQAMFPVAMLPSATILTQ
jgi:hypothetical protein